IATRFIILLDFNNSATPMNCMLCLRVLVRAESRRHNTDSSFSLDNLRLIVKSLYKIVRLQLLKDILLLDLDT
ncbi:hypothetical protein FB567DRAFT_445985, partial [Paraphoma chrysanthemicola]